MLLRSGPMSASRPPATPALALASVLAGATALASETLWTRLLGLVLGHELLGVLAVLAGFFAGLALGAALVHGRAERLARPARVFAGLQMVVALLALVAPWLLHALAATLPRWLGLEPGLVPRLLITTTLLLPATLCLGASLPILIAAARTHEHDDARLLARLYACDTLGATLGVLLTIYVALPRLGVVWTSVVIAAFALAAAGVALLVDVPRAEAGGEMRAPERAAIEAASGDPDDGLLRERWLLYVAFGVTGLLGLGLEVVGVRVLAQVVSGTLYSFADLLAVWLLGTALGSALHAKLSERLLARRPVTVLVLLLVALAIVVALAAGTAANAIALLDWLASPTATFVRRQLAELALALAVFGPATVLMGMVFAHLLALLAAPSGAEARPRPVGIALAINGLCSAAAPLVIGLVVLGRVDYAQTWAAIAWGYLLLALALGWARRFAPRVLALLALVGLLGLATGGSMASSLVLGPDEDEGWVLVEQREAALGVVRVSETTNPPGSPARPLRRLAIDRHFRMGGALAIGDRRMGHIPLLLAGDLSGARVLFLGLGTGATAGTALAYEVEHVEAVELIGEVVDMLPHFSSINANIADDPRATIVVADARRYLLAEGEQHRVIVADLFHPARDGAASLYAREHFEAVRARLDARGVFVQWLPLHQLDEAGLALIVRTFLAVFPDAHAWLGLYNVETPALALIGSVEPLVIDADRLAARLTTLRPLLDELALGDLRDLLGGYVLDREGLEQLGGQGPLHDDLRPRLDFVAARATIGPTRGLDTVTRLLALRRAWPDGLVVSRDPATHAELRAASGRFADALALYIEGEGLRLHAALAGEGRTRAQLEPYLAAYVLEPEFVPPRPWLYAAALADPALAEWILPTMLERTPDEPRVHRAWLAHLARSQQLDRFNLALADARARLGGDFDPGVQPVAK